MVNREHKFQIFKWVGIKFNDLSLRTEWLQGNFTYFAIILSLDFSKIFNIFRIRVFFFFFKNSRKIFKELKTVAISKLFDPT